MWIFVFPTDNCVSPKAAAEELGYTFLPCVLSYLHRAPSLIVLKTKESEAPNSTSKIRTQNAVISTNGEQRKSKKILKARTGSGGVLDLRNVIIADNVDAVVVPVRFSFIHIILKLFKAQYYVIFLYFNIIMPFLCNCIGILLLLYSAGECPWWCQCSFLSIETPRICHW